MQHNSILLSSRYPIQRSGDDFNYANALPKRGHACAVPLAVFSVKPVCPSQFNWKCPLRGQHLTVQFSGYAHCVASTSLCISAEVPNVGPVPAPAFRLDVPTQRPVPPVVRPKVSTVGRISLSSSSGSVNCGAWASLWGSVGSALASIFNKIT
jgi:hypothetical protein